MFEVDFKILNQKATPAIYADVTAAIPTPGFVGRLFVATDSPYGVFRDTGTAWVQVAGSGGGPGSTGVNGLNGTTNIGLGGTLTGTTSILGAANNISFTNNNIFTIDQSNSIDIKTKISSLIAGGRLNLTNTKAALIFGDSFDNSTINVGISRINTLRGVTLNGIDLNFGGAYYTIGDISLTNKKNTIRIDDGLSKIYFTTGRSTSNVDPDLFYAENTSSAIRVVKLGDFGNFNNQTSLQIDDGGNIIFTTTTIGNNGIYINNQNAIFGSQNASGYLFLKCDYNNNIISTFNTFSTDTGLKLNFNNKIYTLGGFNANGNIIEINDDLAFNSIKFETSSLIYNGAALEDPTPGTVATKALLITLNGTQYKINLY